MIKLIDILKEIGEGSTSYNTERIDQGQQIFFKIEDDNFPIDNFYISVSLGKKDEMIKSTSANYVKPRFNLSKSGNDAIKVDFGVVEGNQWVFPVLNKGYLFGIMGTIVKSVKSVLDDNKNVKHLLFIPASKIRSTNKMTPNKDFKSNNNPPVRQDTQVSDNGSQRENLYLAYIKRQLPSATQEKENGWNVINLK